MQKIRFTFHDRTILLGERKKLKAFLEDLFKKEAKPLNSVSYIFCSDSFLLGINNQFLNHDYYTDIITFDLSPNDSGTEAEVYISVDRVRENAENLRASIKEELHRVIFHGALHLCGYKDKKKSEILIMRQKEEECLKNYFR